MWNEQLKLPVPPIESLAAAGASFWATVIFSSLAGLVFLYGLKHWRDTGKPIILLMMLGGAATSLVEPFLDIVGAAWHPIPGQHTAFALMGRPIPWWVVSCYVFYFGAVGSLNYLAFVKGVTLRQVWLWFSVPVLLDAVMEEIMMHQDLYFYYGQQPLILLFKFPFWWAPCNSIGEFIGISLIVLMGSYLRGWKLLLIPLVLPIADSVGYAAVAMPSWIVINTDVPAWVSSLGGLATFALCGLVVHGIALVLAKDSPLRSPANIQSAVPAHGRSAMAAV